MRQQETGPWGAALETLREWDPNWAEACVTMTSNPWLSGTLPRKTVELIGVALNAACTNLNADGTRRHIGAALDAGACRDEILLVLKLASVLSIHSLSLGAQLLLDEASGGALDTASAQRAKRLQSPVASPAGDRMKAAGQWDDAWEPLRDLAPAWTEQFMATLSDIYTSGVLPAKEIALLSIALNASYTHMYAPGTRRHIKAALKAGATVEEIMEVLKLCVAQGVQTCNLGVPILAEELAKRPTTGKRP